MKIEPTISETLRLAQQKLHLVSDTARLDGEILLSHALGCTRTHLRTWPQTILTVDQHDQFLNLLARRFRGEPIAYITGFREFWDMTIQVSTDTLIPRPETEYLVELALEKIPHDAKWTIADLGTGSGAIALAIARERPLCQIVATDASAEALKMARKNAHQLEIDTITFIEGRWFEPLDGQPFEMIVSNPPYVRPGDPHLAQGDLRFEPAQALRSEPDGLTDLRSIIESARKHLTPPGWLMLEHGYDQGPAVTAILETSGYTQVSTAVDLAGHERVSMGNWRLM